MTPGSLTSPRLALLSLEPWDEVWRRNQHLTDELTMQGLAASVVFVEPPAIGQGSKVTYPTPTITVVRPPLWRPRRLGGLRGTAGWLRRHWLESVDLLWVNDPVLGDLCVTSSVNAIYDVTDDWRLTANPPRVLARIVAAEDNLASCATTIVCSAELARRWRDRYDVTATVVNNAAAQPSYVDAHPLIDLEGGGPHVGYVGTLQPERLDVELCVALGASDAVGTLHLVGPDALSEEARNRLATAPGVRLHPPIAGCDVPRWLMSFDALVAPHLETEFTRSLDAIKAFEYLATDRPVVATPTSGFQDLEAPGLAVVSRTEFSTALAAALVDPLRYRRTMPVWAERAREFAAAAGFGE